MFKNFSFLLLIVFFIGCVDENEDKIDIKVLNMGTKAIENFCMHFGYKEKNEKEKCFRSIKNNESELFSLKVRGEGGLFVSYFLENKKIFDKEVVIGYVSNGEKGYINIRIDNEIMEIERNFSYSNYPKTKEDGRYSLYIIKKEYDK